MLAGATLTGVSSGSLVGLPASLPSFWGVADGYLIGPGAELVGAGLTGVQLPGADLESIDLTGASLVSANVNNADLTGANFTYADLQGANLNGAILTGVVWYNTTCPDGTISNKDGNTCANNLG